MQRLLRLRLASALLRRFKASKNAAASGGRVLVWTPETETFGNGDGGARFPAGSYQLSRDCKKTERTSKIPAVKFKSETELNRSSGQGK